MRATPDPIPELPETADALRALLLAAWAERDGAVADLPSTLWARAVLTVMLAVPAVPDLAFTPNELYTDIEAKRLRFTKGNYANSAGEL